MCCKKCNKDLKIVNKFHYLCLVCNNQRLQIGKKFKIDKFTKNKSKLDKTKENKFKYKVTSGIKPKKSKGSSAGKNLKLDEAFYEQCFNECNDHKCEECNHPLPKQFRIDGKVAARFRYSHIMAKSIMPEWRHIVTNINHLCIDCHTKWDFGNKESMKIYKINKKRFPWFFNKS